MHGYYSEMNEARPADTQIDARLSHYGKHYFIKTPLVLKGRGIEYRRTLKAEELTPKAQHKAGWHEYIVTTKAMEKLEKEYKVSIEMLL